MSRRPVLAVGLLAAVSAAASLDGDGEARALPAWNAGLAVSPAASASGSGRASSSRLQVTFTPAAEAVHHYQVAARETSSGRTMVAAVADGARSAVLTGLKSDTSYAVDITACPDAACVAGMSAASGRAFARTEQEIWQVQASADSIAAAARVVSDGNVKVHAIRLGPEAPAPVAERVQLYYGPLPQAHKGLAVAVADSVSTRDVASLSRSPASPATAGC
jgi:hypothetical protein